MPASDSPLSKKRQSQSVPPSDDATEISPGRDFDATAFDASSIIDSPTMLQPDPDGSSGAESLNENGSMLCSALELTASPHTEHDHTQLDTPYIGDANTVATSEVGPLADASTTACNDADAQTEKTYYETPSETPQTQSVDHKIVADLRPRNSPDIATGPPSQTDGSVSAVLTGTIGSNDSSEKDSMLFATVLINTSSQADLASLEQPLTLQDVSSCEQGQRNRVANDTTELDSKALSSETGGPTLAPQTGKMIEASEATIAESSKDDLSNSKGDISHCNPTIAGRYDLLDNFAQGGLGKIWKAKDKAMSREVALKELISAKASRQFGLTERFVDEAQITGQLEHPGIVPIYDIGVRDNGMPFYTMKLLHGGDMDEAIKTLHTLPAGAPERHLAFTRLLRQFIAVCQAVGFAHKKGVLHRDLKPKNVMIGDFGETLVLDWGLAKVISTRDETTLSVDPPDAEVTGSVFRTGEESRIDTIVMDMGEGNSLPTNVTNTGKKTVVSPRVTQKGDRKKDRATMMQASQHNSVVQSAKTDATSTFSPIQPTARSDSSKTMMGQVMGTPAYMPPEQAQGLIDNLDARSDVYSLGGILYKLLTNKAPVEGSKSREVLKSVIEGLIKPPRELDATIPKPLEAICLKAMAKDMAARYPKALDVAADVEAYLADQTVSAYPDPWHERVRRWAKRHRTFITSSSAMMLVLICATFLWQWVEFSRVNRLRTETQKKVAEAVLARDSSDFAKAKRSLEAALVLVRTESKLDSERGSLLIEIDDLNRLQEAAEQQRLTIIQNKVELDLAEVQHAINDNQDFVQAKFILNRVVGQLGSEKAFVELHHFAHTQLEAVSLFESFGQKVEQARIFGGNISGDESLDDIRESKRHALAALEIFESDARQPDKASSRLRSLGDKSISKWRDGMQEVLVTLAYLETKLAIRDDPDELQKAAQRSLDYLQQAEQLGFSSQPMWFLRADLLGLLKLPDEAQTARKKAETLVPQTRLDHYLLGEFKRGQGNYKEALSHFEDALQVDPNDFWSLNMLGLCHFQLGQYDAVIPSCTACIARRPGFDWPYLARGVAFGKRKQFAKAHQDIAKSLELKPQSYHAYLNRGVIFVYQKNYEMAKADFRQASQLKPDQAAPFINLAATGLDQAHDLLNDSQLPNASSLANAELQLANVALTSAIERSPQQGAIYSFRGKIRMAQNDATAALDDFTKANKLEFAPLRRAENFQQIGNIHFRSRQLEAALAAYDQSLEANPDDHTTIRQRAETLLALKRYEDAVRDFTSVLERGGPIADVYRGRSVAFAALNKHREAINDYTMSLQYEPAPNMLAQRGWAYLLEATKLAKEDFEEAVRLNPEDPAFYQGLAYAQVMLGDHASAAAEIEKTSANTKRIVGLLGPKSWQYLFNPATVYSQAHDKALTDLKLTLEKRGELARLYSRKAVELLLEAHQLAGPEFQLRFLKALRSDIALDPIRQSPEYTEALKTIDPESAAKLSGDK